MLPVLYKEDRGDIGLLTPGVSRVVTQGSGTFAHFNGLGAFLTLASCVAFGGWLSHRPSSSGDSSSFCLIFAGVITAYSRGSLLGTFLGCLTVYWLSGRRHSRQAVVAAVCGLTLVALSISGALLRTYYGQTQNVSIRLSTWTDSIAYVVHHPSDLVLGTGYSSFQQIILAPTTQSAGLTTTGQLTAVHSGPLQVLLELGVVGFALYLATLLVPISRALKRPRSVMRAILIGATLGVLFTQVFDNSTFGYAGVLMFALLAELRRDVAEERALSLACNRRAAESQLATIPDSNPLAVSANR